MRTDGTGWNQVHLPKPGENPNIWIFTGWIPSFSGSFLWNWPNHHQSKGNYILIVIYGAIHNCLKVVGKLCKIHFKTHRCVLSPENTMIYLPTTISVAIVRISQATSRSVAHVPSYKRVHTAKEKFSGSSADRSSIRGAARFGTT